MKKLIIKGTVRDVEDIINSLIERYGKDAKLEDVIKRFKKEEVILV